MRRRHIVLLALLLVTAGSARVRAYCLKKYGGQTPFARWTQNPVTYRVSSNLTDPSIIAAIDAAFGVWGAVGCSTLRFVKGASFSIGENFEHGAREIRVYWFTQQQGYPTDPQYVGYPFVGHDNVGGIVQGAIAVNGFGVQWATDGSASKLDVQGVLTGFIGAVLGFAEDPRATDSVLVSTLSPGDTRARNLGQDDLAALYQHYNGGSCPPVSPPGVDGCSGSAGGADGGTVEHDYGAPSWPDSGSAVGDGGGARFDLSGGGGKDCTSGTQCAGGDVCTAEGKCKSVSSGCTSSAQCEKGMVCSTEGSCVKTADGCAVGGQSRCFGAFLLISLMVVLAIRRQKAL